MSPDLELINAALTVLRADSTLTGLVPATRFYDRVPEKPAPAMPYVSIGPTSSLPDDFDCLDGEEISFQLDVWSQGANEAYSSAECRRIVDQVKRLLHNAELSLSVNAVASLQLELKRIVRDPDGVTNHGILQFTAVVETPA